MPEIELSGYRFRAVIDWIELRIALDRQTQHQHVQRPFEIALGRRPFVKPLAPGPGGVADRFDVTIQEPPSIARVLDVISDLSASLGVRPAPDLVGIEVSVDAYANNAREESRTRLLGAMQRTIFTARDVWTTPNSRPRVVFGSAADRAGRSSAPVFKLSPGPGHNKAGHSRLVPDHHEEPPIDATLYLGAKDDDLMIRLMDKVIDTQNRANGTHFALADASKRVRIEATFRGEELLRLGLRSPMDLAGFSYTALQGDCFQFKMPTFSRRALRSAAALDAALRYRERLRIHTFLRAGLVGVMAMDAEREAVRASHLPGLKNHLHVLGRKLPRRRATGPTNDYVAYEDLNRKVRQALRDLGSREARATARSASAAS